MNGHLLPMNRLVAKMVLGLISDHDDRCVEYVVFEVDCFTHSLQRTCSRFKPDRPRCFG